MRVRGEKFLKAVASQELVSGYTHDFYRYPARFSPLFAREVIRTFSRPGDTVFDPFMGSGTSLVEARIHGRTAVGADISSLAVFIAKAKTTVLSDAELRGIEHWAKGLEGVLSLHNPAIRDLKWARLGYQHNINSRATWRIRKTLELALAKLGGLTSRSQQQFARCVLLRTAQWALDCRSELPTASEFRQQFKLFLKCMIGGAREFAEAAAEHDRVHVECLHGSAVGLESERLWGRIPCPRLIITSPPYPGVHVLYHRWQIQGRRETPAPFWIAGTLDGHGESFYTFGDRKEERLSHYYEQARAAFCSLAAIADRATTVVQLVAFSDPSWQLPRYLDAMAQAGFAESKFPSLSNAKDGRLWRSVPNRKWYATQRGVIGASSEVVLFHRLARPRH